MMMAELPLGLFMSMEIMMKEWQPISMMMAELLLGLSMILGSLRKAALPGTPIEKKSTSGQSP